MEISKMPERKRTDPAVEAQVLLKSGRRCCLCVHLNQDFESKLGQIAHLDRDPSNGSEDNLAFLCLEHHTIYDSRTSQHKNFTINEVISARSRLYVFMQMPAQAKAAQAHGPLTQSGGVNFGIASNIQVYGDVVAGDKSSHRPVEVLRERGEELYGHIDKWLNGLAGNYLRINSVMQGKLTYNQHLDLTIAESQPGFDFGRIQLLIDLYFPSVRPAYDKVIEARTALNRIATVHKHAYEDGDFDGTPYLKPYIDAQLKLEMLGSDLKRQLVDAIR